MPRGFELYLRDILEAITRIESYVEDVDQRGFAADQMRVDAVIRNLEVIGEAAKHLRESERALAPDIPWRKIAGLRNILAHEYFGVDLDIVWDVIITHLPPLRRAVSILI
ncbi:MAG: DUF86 domain-containing protein [Chrysiogenetes bacterium]|nr:DUF86 domain-containing protein [Chrysiogenetes bacterium]